MQKSVRRIHDAVYEPIADLAPWRAMPTHSIDHLDPFLFLNHHGPQEYGPNNNGLPFGPHPHRGFETLTFVLQGDITHKDSVSGESVITAGGIQWMTAGSGLIHAEVSSDEFKQRGGWEEVIQLWMNLPAKFKMTEPNYTGLQEADITAIEVAGGQGTLKLVSGTYGDHEGPIDSLTNLFTSTLTLREGAEFVDRVRSHLGLALAHAGGIAPLFSALLDGIRDHSKPVRVLMATANPALVQVPGRSKGRSASLAPCSGVADR